MAVKVLIVDDDALVRSGLKLILGSVDDVEVVGEADDGSGAVDAVRTLRPDVVLMDIRMPELDGVSATEQVRALPDPPAVIVLTTISADGYVMRALQAGASGFLLKDTPPLEIIDAIRQVASGGAMLSPSVTRTLLDHIGDDTSQRRADEARRRLEVLTDREREVATAVGAGNSNPEIAAALFMSEATVKAHISRILTKLESTNRVQVALIVRDAESAPGPSGDG